MSKKSESVCDARCCSASRKWVWMLLALAILGVVVVKRQEGAKKSTREAVPVVNLAQCTNSPGSVISNALPRLVDLGAGKCIPCKLMAPILEDLKKTCAGKLTIQFIDVWENPKAGEEYGVKLIPTQIFYDAAGKELFRHEGFYSQEDILAKWKEFGVELEQASGVRSRKAE